MQKDTIHAKHEGTGISVSVDRGNERYEVTVKFLENQLLTRFTSKHQNLQFTWAFLMRQKARWEILLFIIAKDITLQNMDISEKSRLYKSSNQDNIQAISSLHQISLFRIRDVLQSPNLRMLPKKRRCSAKWNRANPQNRHHLNTRHTRILMLASRILVA